MAAQCQHAPPPADFESHAVPSGTKLTLTLPDDFHHHFRDGPKVPDVLRLATQRFGRAIAMPNLQPVSDDMGGCICTLIDYFVAALTRYTCISFF